MDESDYVQLGSACARVSLALHRGLKGKDSSGFDGSVLDAISELTT